MKVIYEDRLEMFIAIDTQKENDEDLYFGYAIICYDKDELNFYNKLFKIVVEKNSNFGNSLNKFLTASTIINTEYRDDYSLEILKDVVELEFKVYNDYIIKINKLKEEFFDDGFLLDKYLFDECDFELCYEDDNVKLKANRMIYDEDSNKYIFLTEGEIKKG